MLKASLSHLLLWPGPLGCSSAWLIWFPVKSGPHHSAISQAGPLAAALYHRHPQAVSKEPFLACLCAPLTSGLLSWCPWACLPAPHATPCPDHSPPSLAPQPHIPSSSLSPSPLFLLSHGTSPWHAATAGAGELHGPQKSQAVRQSRQAARLYLANTPLMSFQKIRGRERALASNHLFLFSFRKKKFLPNETWGLGGG